MKKFIVHETIVDNLKLILIFSTSYISPLKYLFEIELELKNKQIVQGNIVFDFLLCSKNDSERYASMYFDGNNLKKASFCYMTVDKKALLRKESLNFYYKEKNNLDFTFLSSIKKNIIFKNIAI